MSVDESFQHGWTLSWTLDARQVRKVLGRCGLDRAAAAELPYWRFRSLQVLADVAPAAEHVRRSYRIVNADGASGALLPTA